MGVEASAWCVVCGAPPVATITTEMQGVLLHYGACWEHLTAVAQRVRRDEERDSLRPGGLERYTPRQIGKVWPEEDD